MKLTRKTSSCYKITQEELKWTQNYNGTVQLRGTKVMNLSIKFHFNKMDSYSKIQIKSTPKASLFHIQTYKKLNDTNLQWNSYHKN